MQLKRWQTITLITFAAAIVGFFILTHFAIKILKDQIEQALGPESTIKEMHVGLTGITISGIRIQAPLKKITQERWPAPDQLRAQSIVIVPDILGLLSANIRIRSITIDQAYLCILREPNGALKILPSLIAANPQNAKKDKKNVQKKLEIRIGEILLTNSSIDFFDASVRQPAHKLQLQKLRARIKNIHLPNLNSTLDLTIDGTLKGIQHQGAVSIYGTTNIATHDSNISTTLKQIDLLVFQPYFIKATESGVRSGLLDLNLYSRINNNHLHAPGKLILSKFELQPANNKGGTFAGLPLKTVIGFMKNSDNQINLNFTLEGNLNDPNFSLNENFSTRIASSLSGAMGLSLEDIARATGNLGKKTVGAAGAAGSEIGNRLKQLFGK